MDIESSYIDELTGVYNRRYLKEKQEDEIKAFIAKNVPFSVVMVDIDHFKEINDTYGHLRGDEIIKAFAQFLKNTLRSMDTVVRYGGDEFVCVMPHTVKHDAEVTYRRILKNCKEQKFEGLKITLSAGIASYPDNGRDFDELLDAADQALYDAKRSGRDRIKTPGEKKAEIPIKAFVDRVKEKDKIKTSLIDSTGEIRVVVLKGNVGIGKTRLGKEVLTDIRGKEIIWCDCIFFTEEIPYYPIREVIKYRIQRLGMDAIKDVPLAYKIEIGKLIPEIMSEIEDEVKGLELVMDKYRLFEGVRRMLDVGERDKIIILDNIQWIDRESTEVLKYLMRALRERPITFIFIYRAEEKTETLENFISYISREVEITDTVLAPFEYQDIKKSVKMIIGEEPEKSLTEYITRESGGNPFYIEEIMRELLDGGYLAVEEDKWVFKAPEKKIVPKTLTDIAMRKYRTLSQEGKNVLEIASVIGWFDLKMLKEITGYNEGHIMGLINNIARLGMTKSVQDRFKFSDAISRNAIYTNHVRGPKRMELHRQVAERIEEQNKGKEHGVADELAVHYFHAQDKEKGTKYCIKAGDQSKEEYANSNAIRYYTWTIELLDKERERNKIGTRIECLVKRARLLNFIGENENALRDLEDGLKQASELGDKKRLADIKYEKANINISLSRYEDAQCEASEAVKLFRESGNINLAAKAMMTIGTAYLRQGECDKALEVNTDALEIVKEIKDTATEANLLNNIGNIYVSLSDYGKALLMYEDALRIFRELGDKSGESRVLNNIGTIHYNSGNYAEALIKYEDALQIFREIGNRINEPVSLRNIGMIYYNKADFSKALHFYEEALRIVRDVGNRDDEAILLSDVGDIHKNFGDYDRTLRYYENALKIAEAIKSNRMVCFISVSIADLYMVLDRHKKAKKYLDQAHKIAAGSKEMLQNVLPCFCDYYLERENLAKFDEMIRTIQSLFKGEKTKSFEGDMNILLGRYYGATRDFEKSDECFRNALTIFHELKEPVSIGKTHYYWGCVALTRGRKTAAQENLKESVEIFRTARAMSWIEKAENALKTVRKKTE